MVSGIERQAAGDRANQGCHVRRLYLRRWNRHRQDEAYLQQHHRSFGSRPIRVLTSGNHGVGHLERKPPDTPEAPQV